MGCCIHDPLQFIAFMVDFSDIKELGDILVRARVGFEVLSGVAFVFILRVERFCPC